MFKLNINFCRTWEQVNILVSVVNWLYRPKQDNEWFVFAESILRNNNNNNNNRRNNMQVRKSTSLWSTLHECLVNRNTLLEWMAKAGNSLFGEALKKETIGKLRCGSNKNTTNKMNNKFGLWGPWFKNPCSLKCVCIHTYIRICMYVCACICQTP